jgi:thioredoxin reductase
VFVYLELAILLDYKSGFFQTEVGGNGMFKVNEHEQTNVENIYAVGDVLYG